MDFNKLMDTVVKKSSDGNAHQNAVIAWVAMKRRAALLLPCGRHAAV